MSYSGPVTIYHRSGWKLDSYGNGAAYTLSHELPAGKSESCFFQGDEAAAFREEFDLADKPPFLFQEYLHVMQPDESPA